MTKKWVCIGVPYYIGESMDSDSELRTIRDTIPAEIGAEWIEVQPAWQEGENPVITVNRTTAEVIASHPDCTPLVFAPDCVSAWGIMKGLEAKAPDVLWFDAHGDFNTPETTRSGYLGGMPLAAMVGRGNEDLMRGLSFSPISETKVTLTDARNLDPEEGELVRSSAVTHLKSIRDVLNVDWAKKPLYIHLDTDVLDPADMPTLNYPEPNGPSLDELIDVLKHVRQSASVAGIYISLWDDALPGADAARAATLQLTRTLVS